MDIEKVKKSLMVNKPKLTKNSIKTYIFILKGLYDSYILNDKNKKFDNKELNPLFLLDTKNVMRIIKSEEKLNTRKTQLSVCYTFIKCIYPNDKRADIYHEKMIELSKEYNEWLKSQEKTETQTVNWITKEELDNIVNELCKEVEEYKTLESLTKEQYKNLQVYILLRLIDTYSIRNEYSNLQMVNEKPEKKINYCLSKNSKYTIVLNIYKTKKYLGIREYVIPSNITSYIKLLLQFNKTGFLFSNIKNTDALGSNGMTKLLTSFFKKKTGKNISSSMIRHIQATEDYKDEEPIRETERKDKEIENKYLHNSKQHRLYAKY
jgi:hypothetical protein